MKATADTVHKRPVEKMVDATAFAYLVAVSFHQTGRNDRSTSWKDLKPVARAKYLTKCKIFMAKETETKYDSVCVHDIISAAKRIRPFAVVTPLLESDQLNRLMGCRVLVKAENLQRTGSFKFRGACNAVLSASDSSVIVTFSSGNHAQAVACACSLFDKIAYIVMPSDAPKTKIELTKAFGANVVFYDRKNEDRELIAQKYVEEFKASLVKPFDQVETIAGQGTLGLEIGEQVHATKLISGENDPLIDAVLVPVSGGGLITGVAVAVKSYFPHVTVHPVEPLGYDDLKRTLERGELTKNPQNNVASTLCDSLMSPQMGPIPYSVSKSLLSPGFAGSDDDVLKGMYLAWRHLKIVLEPGGALPLGVLFRNKTMFQCKTVVVVASGGNVDPEVFAKCLDGSQV